MDILFPLGNTPTPSPKYESINKIEVALNMMNYKVQQLVGVTRGR